MAALIFAIGVFAAFIIHDLWFSLAKKWDENRIEQEIHAMGGEFLAKKWSPFGKGWLGDKSDRIYIVKYLDKEGNEHQTYVKTSMFSGVYFSEDTIIKGADNDYLQIQTSRVRNE